jgi:hypothetical protein
MIKVTRAGAARKQGRHSRRQLTKMTNVRAGSRPASRSGYCPVAAVPPDVRKGSAFP